MEQLQKQQEKISEIIKSEQERKQKLSDMSSIERLEALINPITDSLDFITQYNQQSRRLEQNRQYERRRIKHLTYNDGTSKSLQTPPLNKFDFNPALASEEIFMTLLNILKRQESRIKDLESLIVLKN
jgi:hypothetical protein